MDFVLKVKNLRKYKIVYASREIFWELFNNAS